MFWIWSCCGFSKTFHIFGSTLSLFLTFHPSEGFVFRRLLRVNDGDAYDDQNNMIVYLVLCPTSWWSSLNCRTLNANRVSPNFWKWRCAHDDDLFQKNDRENTIAIKVTVIMTIILTITVAISKDAMHSSAIVSPNSNPRSSSWPFLSPEIGAVLALLLVPVKQCQALSATPHSTWPEQKWNYESPNKKTLD